MELTVSGKLTRAEVDALVKAHLEKTTGKKVANLSPEIRNEDMEGDWRAEFPQTPVLRGYTFELSKEEFNGKNQETTKTEYQTPGHPTDPRPRGR